MQVVPTWAATFLSTAKDSLQFYIATSQPRLDANRPIVDSINILVEWFFARFTHVTGTETGEEGKSKVRVRVNNVKLLICSVVHCPQAVALTIC